MKVVTALIILAASASPALAANAAPTATPAAASAPRQGVFEKADANHDGIVTKEEFLASEGQYFDSVDANHDGKLTQDEIKAQRDRSHAKRMAWKQEHAAAPSAGAAPAPAAK